MTTITRPDVFDSIVAILEEIGEVDPAIVTPESLLNADLDLDSLLMVEVTVAAGEKFGTDIPDDDITELQTVGDLVELVAKHTSS